MAIDLFSILAMSSEAECVFSIIKKTVSQGRWSLRPNTLEALECLKSWFRAGYYTQEELHEILRLQEEAERLDWEEVELEERDDGAYIGSTYCVNRQFS